ncbi:MAG: hypothetical protein ACFFED_15085 [Candidatus Thorarchaeota archaeon]
MKSEKKERTLSFKCCVPTNVSACSDDDLRLSLVTLKNAQANVTVCIRRLERELKRRGVSPSLLASVRGEPSPEILELVSVTPEP